jgi:hypothetical protein
MLIAQLVFGMLVVVISLYSYFTFKHRVEQKKKIQKGLAGEIKEAGIRIIGNRPLTPAESRFFSTDNRFSAWLLITLGLWCLFFSGKHPV